MQFAILAEFSGIPDEHDPCYWPCDLTYTDALRASREADLDVTETEPGDSDYSYLADEVGEPRGEYWDAWHRYVQDATVSGILDRARLTRWLDDLGAYAEDVETLGTLGGPANPCGIAPDIALAVESQALIASIRVTPLLDVEPHRIQLALAAGNEARACYLADRAWARMRRAFLHCYGA